MTTENELIKELRTIENQIEEIYNGTRAYSELAGLEHRATCIEIDIRNIQRSYIKPEYMSMSY